VGGREGKWEDRNEGKDIGKDDRKVKGRKE
jgi:hypothetical protein